MLIGNESWKNRGSQSRVLDRRVLYARYEGYLYENANTLSLLPLQSYILTHERLKNILTYISAV